MTDKPLKSLTEVLATRFGDPPAAVDLPTGAETIAAMAARRSQRRYRDEPVPPALVETVAAAAFSAPTKSDLQQRDIVVVRDGQVRAAIDALFAPGSWIATAPVFLVFLANNRRQRQIAEWRGRAFANDHLDAFFNATVDAAIVLAAFVTAAEAVGLGCCPISELRNHSGAVSELLGLPDHVFAIAGLTLGWPSEDGAISPRLPLDVTLHTDRFSEDGLAGRIDAYDARRAEAQPYARQRYSDQFGEQDFYGWSEDKARQYTQPQRTDFGAFVRAKGFNLD